MFYDPWEQYLFDEDSGQDGYDMDRIPEVVVLGLADGYDDGRIDAVIMAYLELRRKAQGT